ncbi:uncharacterized protein LOC111694396 [Trichogramma pretiosum]|uniref:uncharacterized protein LOC111694396 n=1 Tax=Trichogramma pretiosum TaxID=7493 RepID=UPI000C71B30E|nr:uncharacterized protein LOC111694396 [Trichogramma pretiosum]
MAAINKGKSEKKATPRNTQRKSTKKNKVKAKKGVVKVVRTTRPKRRKYTTSDVQNALKAIKNCSMRKASLVFNIPLATLSRKNKNPQSLEKKPGTGPVLGVETEAKIAQWIKHRAQNGFSVTKDQVLDAVDSYVKAEKLPNPFAEDRPGRHWFEAFKKRQGVLTIRKAQQLSHTRAEVTQEDLKEWFISVEKFLASKDIMHLDPSRVFNCDETSLKYS